MADTQVHVDRLVGLNILVAVHTQEDTEMVELRAQWVGKMVWDQEDR